MLLGVICNDSALQRTLLIVKNTLNFIQIIGPILCIISLIVIMIQLVNNPEDKKAAGRIKNLFTALILLFTIPVLIDSSMYIMDDSFKVSSCWKNASEDIEESEYLESDKEKKKFVIDSDKYGDGGSGSNSKSSNKASKTEKTNVLFVGNSMTYREGNEKQRITEVFKGMIKNGGYSNMSVYVANKSGSTLSQVASAKNGIITARKYDIVILQEQTDAYENKSISKFLKGAQTIKKLVQDKNPNAKIYIRQKWVTKGNLSKSMHDTAYNNAASVAGKIGASLIYDGKAFDNSMSKYPGINLYSDSRHQSADGAYLSAACIYKTVTGGSPNSLTYNGYISEANAKKLREIAKSTC